MCVIYPTLLFSTESTKGAHRGYVWGNVTDPVSKRSTHMQPAAITLLTLHISKQKVSAGTTENTKQLAD